MKQFVNGYFYAVSNPTPIENPVLVSASDSALQLLDFQKSQIEELKQYNFNDKGTLSILSGNTIISNNQILSHCYCGIQFGEWAGQLGDGRAHILGSIKNKDKQIWEIQLKGSGKTPFSRQGDGRAVIRSSVREFLASEAMHFLNIPTTRAATLIISDTTVFRDKLYNGQIEQERCAVVARISNSFLRFGSFQIFRDKQFESGPSFKQKSEMLPKLLEFTLKNYFSDIWSIYSTHKLTLYSKFFERVVKDQAKLVAKWQTVGFVHGVLNSDNVSIIGQTIDYGPFEFIGYFSKKHVSNYSDNEGRYSYENQPDIILYNLKQLSEDLDPGMGNLD